MWLSGDDLHALTDEQLTELFDDALDEPYEPAGQRSSLVGYARPATRDPRGIDPFRPLVGGPAVDDYRPRPPAPQAATTRSAAA